MDSSTTLSLSLTNAIITSTIVSSTNTPSLNLSPEEKRALLFDVGSPFEIFEEEFDNNWWPLVSNIWTQFNYCKLRNGDSWKVFVCRLNKYQNSSERKEEIPLEKRRKTMIWLPDLCQAKIKVSWLVSTKIIRIENFKNSAKHTHFLKKTIS